MKDVAHHLKYVQKKVIQSSRKETLNSQPNKVQTPAVFEHADSVSRKKIDANHRVPHVPVRSQFF